MSAKTPPNIVLILTDDMGYSDLGCMGSEILTPNLDRLAAGGVLFTQAYNCGRCCPTRASIVTGLWSTQAGIGHMVGDSGVAGYRGFLNPDAPTIAEILKPRGYRSMVAGKWHVAGQWPRKPGPAWRLGDPRKPLPLDRGFDRFFGCPSGGSYANPSPLIEDDHYVEPGVDFYSTDDYASAGIEFIEQSVDDGNPFFLHLTFQAPHWPLHAPAENVAKYRGMYRVGGWEKVRADRYARMRELGVVGENGNLSPRDPGAPSWDDEEHKDWQDARMAVYAAQIDRMDQNIGRLIETLERLGQMDNTIVMFLSDNGASDEEIGPGHHVNELSITPSGRRMRVGNDPAVEPGPTDTFQSYGLAWANASNTPLRLFKSWNHEGGVCTPLIVHWPGGVAGPRMTHEPVHLVDIVATLAHLADADWPETRNGRPCPRPEGESFASLLAGADWHRTTPIYWDHQGNRAVREGDWKLAWDHRRGQWELYNLDEDRTELNDLSSEHPDRVKHLRSLFEAWADRVGVIDYNVLRG